MTGSSLAFLAGLTLALLQQVRVPALTKKDPCAAALAAAAPLRLMAGAKRA